ncbi:MAG: YeeE/YedE thiosulfate transporter family protein, partial [Sagittula sp.]
GHFRWEACEDPRELRRQIFGAALMGGGAVVALGCSIGQGLSAFSVLAFSAPVTFASIFAGAAFGLRQLIVGFQPAE